MGGNLDVMGNGGMGKSERGGKIGKDYEWDGEKDQRE